MIMTAISTARWALGGYAQQYPWEQCRYCGRAQSHDCRPVACLLCGSVQCHGNGSGNGTCALCHYGYLPGWYRSPAAQQCGYRRCEESAVAIAPRVGTACSSHAAVAKLRIEKVTLTDYVADRMAQRDAGRLAIGMRRWQLVA